MEQETPAHIGEKPMIFWLMVFVLIICIVQDDKTGGKK